MAAVEPSKRDTLEKALGQYGAEAVAIASDPGYVLWTDDVVEGLFAVGEFGVKRRFELYRRRAAEAGVELAPGERLALVRDVYVAPT